MVNIQASLKIAAAFIVIIVVVVMGAIYFEQNVSHGIPFVKTDKPSFANVSPPSSSLKLIQTISLPNVNGIIDHMAIDTKNQKLFIAELENNSLDVIDLKASRRIHSVSNNGLGEPQSVIFIPDLNRIFVSNGRDGTVDIFDAKSFSFIKKIKLPSVDADNMRYDPNNKLVYVGYGEGSLGIINATNYNIVGDIKLTGHPESFQIEEQKRIIGQQQRIFVNVPLYNSIAVVNSEKHTVSTMWPIVNAQNNFPMALDEANHRLFVGTRDPPKLMVFDTESGKVISLLDIAKDPDDIFYDAAKKRIYVSCGEGFINVFQQQEDANHYNAIGSIRTAQGARTSLLVAELDRFYLAVPHLGNQESKILVYEVGQ
jgi:DNA-binding beta-propeller fold protein YncE